MISAFNSIDRHLLDDDKPSNALDKLLGTGISNLYPFTLLSALKTTKQSPKHHPEGDVWKHTLMVVDEAAKLKSKSKNPRVLMWAALLHDIGKPASTRTKKGRITAYNHDRIGAQLSREFLSFFQQYLHLEPSFVNDVYQLVYYHMQILYVVNDLPFKDIQEMKAHSDIREIALLGLCDRLGRGNSNKKEEDENINLFLELCEQ